jgi:hypothetical protein
MFVVNPTSTDENAPEVKIPFENAIHIDLNKDKSIVTDIRGSTTYGVWSYSPVMALQNTLTWKWFTIRNDMLWRARNLPRLKHTVDTSAFSPDSYTGTHAEKLEAARVAAKDFLDDYAEAVMLPEGKPLEVDQGWVVGTGANVEYVEPSKAGFNAPDPVLDRTNQSLAIAMGISQAFTGAAERSFASTYITSEFMLKKGLWLAERISSKYLDLVKIHLKYASVAGWEDIVKYVYPRLAIFLEKDWAERVRQTAVMTETGKFTTNEIRDILGYDPLTPEEEAELEAKSARRSESLREITSTEIKRRGPPTEDSNLPKYPAEGQPQ